MPQPPQRRRLFHAGALAVAPMLPGLAPFGMVCGLSAVDTGLTATQAMATSVVIFAGAAQLAMLQLVSEGALPAIILLTALTINLRFAMYSASVAPYFQHLGMAWRGPLAYVLVDQSYALSIARFRTQEADWLTHGHWFFLGAGSLLWLTWQAATAVGVFLAARIPASWQLDFAIPLVFMVLLVPALSSRPHVIAAATGGMVATLGAELPLNLGIVTGAFTGIAAGVVTERRSARQCLT